jgi:hypothetical protein
MSRVAPERMIVSNSTSSQDLSQFSASRTCGELGEQGHYHSLRGTKKRPNLVVHADDGGDSGPQHALALLLGNQLHARVWHRQVQKLPAADLAGDMNAKMCPPFPR